MYINYLEKCVHISLIHMKIDKAYYSKLNWLID